MADPANYRQLLTFFREKPDHIQNYFSNFPGLVEDYEWEISISYVFARIEVAKHTTLYCGLVKRHWADAELTRSTLDRDHITRERFRSLFKTVFGKPIPDAIAAKLAAAESVRDRVAHGKQLKPVQARRGLADAFDFAEEFSEFVQQLAGFCPFGDLRGFKGRLETLPKETTRWVLRGMGIPAHPKD